MATSPAKQTVAPLSMATNFATAGAGGLMGWVVVHPFNTLGIRMNLSAAANGKPVSFYRFSQNIVAHEGVSALYQGIGAGLLRQLFYATSRFGLFEVFRDMWAQYRPMDIVGRLVCGMVSGGELVFDKQPIDDLSFTFRSILIC